MSMLATCSYAAALMPHRAMMPMQRSAAKEWTVAMLGRRETQTLEKLSFMFTLTSSTNTPTSCLAGCPLVEVALCLIPFTEAGDQLLFLPHS